jgi:ribosomal-protein-alanine N-acetyltransferase
MSEYVSRGAEENDGERLVELFAVLDREAEYMLFEPGERVLDAVRQRSLIREMQETGLRTVFIAEEGEVLLGYAGVTRLQFRRRRHLGQVVVGVLREHHRKQIGDALLEKAEAWAGEKEVSRLELTVAVPNVPAVALYMIARRPKVRGTEQAVRPTIFLVFLRMIARMISARRAEMGSASLRAGSTTSPEPDTHSAGGQRARRLWVRASR